MDYTLFRFDACVDWLELEFWTRSRHPAWRLWEESAGAFSYVTGLDPETGEDIREHGTQGRNTPTTRFSARIQNPQRFDSIAAALGTLTDCMQVSVRSVEISFDAYRRAGTTDEQLAEMTATMLHQICRPNETNEVPRFYSWKGTPEQRWGRESVYAGVLSGATAMYGNKDDDYVVRGYLKNYDTVTEENGEVTRLSLENASVHRARVEVRLQGQACEIYSLDELRLFRFESLARFFKFRQPASDLQGLDTLIANRLGSIGNVLDSKGNKTEAHMKRGRSRKTRASSEDSPLSEIARNKLRELTKRWQCEAGRARRRRYDSSGINVASS